MTARASTSSPRAQPSSSSTASSASRSASGTTSARSPSSTASRGRPRSRPVTRAPRWRRCLRSASRRSSTTQRCARGCSRWCAPGSGRSRPQAEAPRSERAVRLWLLGVRGSTPAPGPDFVRYGGHTSCVAVAADGADAPDARARRRAPGCATLTALPRRARPTAARSCSATCTGTTCRGSRSSPRGDRVRRPRRPVPAGPGRHVAAATCWPDDVAAALPDHPGGPALAGGGSTPWRPGTHEIEGFDRDGGRDRSTRAAGRTATGSTSGPARSPTSPTTAPAAGVSDEARAAGSQGVDVLVHDAQFVEAERADRRRLRARDRRGRRRARRPRPGSGGWCCSTTAPARTDDAIDLLVEAVSAPMPVTAAREGGELEV